MSASKRRTRLAESLRDSACARPLECGLEARVDAEEDDGVAWSVEVSSDEAELLVCRSRCNCLLAWQSRVLCAVVTGINLELLHSSRCLDSRGEVTCAIFKVASCKFPRAVRDSLFDCTLLGDPRQAVEKLQLDRAGKCVLAHSTEEGLSMFKLSMLTEKLAY